MPWRELTDTNLHWRFLRESPWRPGLFLQSPAWGNIEKNANHQVRSFGFWQKNNLVGVALVVRKNLPFKKTYWALSKGPVWSAVVTTDEQETAFQELARMAGAEGAVFLRAEPKIVFHKLVRTIDDEPRATTVVTLLQTPEALLGAMHQKTRYNLKLAERHGLTFRWAGAGELGNFSRLLTETAGREGFRTHEPGHYASIFSESDSPDFEARLGLVEFEGGLLAGSLVVICQGTATYLHGASSRSHRELMAPYLLHGAAMASLAKEGVSRYDLWGVQPSDGSLSAWSGFSRFKLGFGGTVVEEPGTFDMPLSRSGYLLYRSARVVRRWVGKIFGV